MHIYPLSEGSFTIDQTKVFVPFNHQNDNLQQRPKGSLLVEIQPFVVITENEIILLDTGLGYFNKEGILQLHANLMSLGINPSSVTKVFLSHLHKDHAGGINYLHPTQPLRYSSFPNATYYIQQREYQWAMKSTSSSYQPEVLSELQHNNKVVWLTADEGVIDQLIHYKLTGGHSVYHQVCWIKEQGEILFFGADVAPQLQQMKSRFVAKYDVDGKISMNYRQEWWEQGKKEKWKFAFYHDLKYPTQIPEEVS